MSENQNPACPECEALDRRDFIRVVSAGAAAITATAGLAVPRLRAEESKKVEKPAEGLIKELHSTLSADQKKQVCLPFDHKMGNSPYLTRQRMYNGAINVKIGAVYDKKQQELIERILRSISSGEEGYRCLTRGGTWDASKTMDACGANLFGDPTDGQWAFVFAGHHLTVRCDGDSEPGAAFGGPMYYGHSPNGYSDKNIFFYQTKAVMSVFDALDAKQRKQAVLVGKSKFPGEHEKSVELKGAKARPGVAYADLSKDQQELVGKVMREVLSPYRKEDADEVMKIIKETGGMEKINLAFYHDGEVMDEKQWDFWRLEGPGFVWNYRVLPHVHTYVNISSKI
jgi:hypothetical protein